MAYEHFYQFYDKLMDDVPYDDYIRLVKQNIPRGTRLLDLGCGTGKVLVPLLKDGYIVDGLDNSEEMLLVVQSHLMELDLHTTLFLDDMRHVKRPEYYDGIYSFIDTINYLTNEDDLKDTFNGVYESLKPGGYFIFDVHNKDYIEQVFFDYSYHEQFENFTYLWDTFLEIEKDQTRIEHDLSFFVLTNEGLYKRMDEAHLQVSFKLDIYLRLLKEAQFTDIDILSDFEKGINPFATKYQLVCRKLE